MDKRTFIELPGDEYGNRGYTASQPVVILVDYEPGKGEIGTLGGTGILHILEPEDFQNKWPTVRERTLGGGWIEVEHEPGPISEEEYVNLLKTKTAYLSDWMIEAAEKRAGLEHGISGE